MLEPEVIQILAHIDRNESFLLSGGAGSGKTYSLEQLVRELAKTQPKNSIAVITYTNAASDIIKNRVQHPNLWVSTIHDFFWNLISKFQIELKSIVCGYHNDQDNKSIRYTGVDIQPHEIERITYDNFVSIRKGVISHDEVLLVAEKMFATYPKLANITKDQFRYIFVDEYQDTSPKAISILLDHLPKSDRMTTLGFFGDSMQAIYDEGIDSLTERLANGTLNEVQKTQNRRNPKSVIDLTNKLRTDGIVQVPSNDLSAPNMSNGQIKQGSVRFFYSDGDLGIDQVRERLSWDFNDVRHVKELNLTHNLIAPRAGFPTLMDIYNKDKILDYRKLINKRLPDDLVLDGKSFEEVLSELEEKGFDITPQNGQQAYIDQREQAYELAKGQNFESFARLMVVKEHLVDGVKGHESEPAKRNLERDDLIKHLHRIQTVVHLYKNGNITEFLKSTNFRIKRLKDKQALSDAMAEFAGSRTTSIGDAIELANQLNLVKQDDRLNHFIQQKPYLWGRVKLVPYSEFVKLFEYLEGRSPLSTQHKVKGNEFENVLVVLDNGNWNKYNFEYLFTGSDTASVLDRTQKLFYVACTRAKDELVVYFSNPSQSVLSKAKDWFGENNVLQISANHQS